jgi:tetratricopeptide (TPR) repeat protein
VLDKAVKLAPDLPSGHSTLGMLLARLGKDKEAEKAYRKAIACDDSFDFAHYLLAGLLIDQGRFDEAVAHCKKVVELDPDEGDNHYLFGVTLAEWARRDRAAAGAVTPEVLARFDEAEARFRAGIRVDTNHHLSWYSLGNVLRDQGELDRAAAAFQEAIRLRPMYAEAHYNLGNVYARLGLYGKALEAYHDAAVSDPDLGEARQNLGTTQVALKRYAEAETTDRMALARGAKPVVAVNLAIALQRQGRFKEALELLKQQQKQLPPGDPARQKAEELIPPYTWYVAVEKN